MHPKKQGLLIILKIHLEFLQRDPSLALFLELLLLLLHAVIQRNLRGIQTADVDEILQHFAFGEGQHLLLGEVDPACNPAEDQRKRVLCLVGDAVVPGQLQAVVRELDVLFRAEPVEASPQ